MTQRSEIAKENINWRKHRFQGGKKTMTERSIFASELIEIEELENKVAPSVQWEVNG